MKAPPDRTRNTVTEIETVLFGTGLWLLALETLIAGLQATLQKRLRQGQDMNTKAFIDDKIDVIDIGFDPVADGVLINITKPRRILICKERSSERTWRTTRIISADLHKLCHYSDFHLTKQSN